MHTVNQNNGISMVEFFSGIGGMRCAIQCALDGCPRSASTNDYTINTKIDNDLTPSIKWYLKSCIAYEISLYANQTYSLNFDEPISSFKNDKRNNSKSENQNNEHKKLKRDFAIYTKLIEQLEPQDVNEVDLWTMSPPCQPFTSTINAKQLDSVDERCKGLKAIISLLRLIDDERKRPRWILVENVKGFYGSDMLQLWYECLKDCGYSWEEYILNPTQLGIPNNRSRYYMIAERSNRFQISRSIRNDLPQSFKIESIKPLSNYIQHLGKEEFDRYVVPDNVFEKGWARDLPIVSELDRISHCFTAAYARRIHRATGSLLLIDNERKESVANDPIDRSNMKIYRRKLRRFTETELLNLFGFPSTFRFPDNLTLDHRYKLIGNSVNVKVVSFLLRYLLLNCDEK